MFRVFGSPLEIFEAPYRFLCVSAVSQKVCLCNGIITYSHTAVVMAFDSAQVPSNISDVEHARKEPTPKGVEPCDILHNHFHAHWIKRYTNDCVEARIHKLQPEG